MKKIIFLLAVIPIALNAQLTSICDSSPNYGKHPFHSASTAMDFSSEPPLVIDTFFHDPEDPDIPELTEADFLSSIAYLNQTYNQFNIFFKYRGFDTNFEAIENMLNIYTNSGLGGSALGGVASVTYQAFTNENNRRFILAHEVGHLLGLLHPTSGNNISGNFMTPLNCNGDTIAEGNFAVTTSSSERVTRDPLDVANFNADVAGDFVVDTPAHYPIVNLCINTNTIPPTLEYLFSNEVVDFVGVHY